ncbi:hypothetical protein [Streptomyces albipurpureus]|uniref:Uncharacterized protein n=1 Tax=Streptomyces albipurpureus TaxID=2897419 RepID=A0ABT0UWU9_9ACTN|nr:hypothetical protein [Streptomyces sp. CWNU-1]MCM2392570.1 hypothetical protein [Streptomyces sp. CWNU-1]
MRNPIVRALAWVLNRFCTREPGRHSAQHLAQRPAPTPVQPCAPDFIAELRAWSRPWTGPSSELARSIFRAEETDHLTPECRERYFATAWAERGYDYPYVALTGVHQVPTGVHT